MFVYLIIINVSEKKKNYIFVNAFVVVCQLTTCRSRYRNVKTNKLAHRQTVIVLSDRPKFDSKKCYNCTLTIAILLCSVAKQTFSFRFLLDTLCLYKNIYTYLYTARIFFGRILWFVFCYLFCRKIYRQNKSQVIHLSIIHTRFILWTFVVFVIIIFFFVHLKK